MGGVSNPKVRGFGFSKPTTFLGTDGTFVNPAARHSVTVNPDREAVERDEDINSYGDVYPATPGVQLFDAAVTFDACQNNYAELKELFIAALGQEDSAGSAITVTLGGGTTDSQFTYSAGSVQKIVIITGSDGLKYPRGIKSDSGTVCVLNAKLPVGVTVVTVANPSALAGGIFRYLFGTEATYFMTEYDRRGQAKQIKYRGLGCPISMAAIKFDRRKRLGWMFGFKGAAWVKNPGSMQLADPSVMTIPYLSFACDVMWQDLAAPVVPNKVTCKALSFGFAPELIEETGTSGIDGSGNIPGSDVTGYTRGLNWKDNLKLTLTYPDGQHQDDFATWVGVKKQLFLIFYPGAPGKSSAVNRIIIWFPEVVLTAEPKLTTVDNQEAQEVVLNIGRDPSLSLASCLIAMTNS